MALKPARLQWSDDGSLLSLDYGDIYFQRRKGLEESRYVFLERNDLPARFRGLENDSFHIAELGFGSGLNFLLTAQLFAQEAPPSARLVYAAIEKHPVRREDLERIYSHFALPDAATLLNQYPPLVGGFHHLSFYGGRIRLMLSLGDVAETLPGVSGAFDAWYLDGFAPAKNPAMWEESLFPLIAARTRPGGTLATFSAARHVRSGLETAGFAVEKIKGYGVKRVMTVARMMGDRPPPALKKTIAVLGAGIAGCAAAYALKMRGHDVTLIDRSGIAQETSGNPVGILYPKLTVDPSPLGQFHSHAFCFTRQLVRDLALSSWRECGVVHLDLDEEDAERTQALLTRNEFPPDFAAAAHIAGHSGLEQPVAGMLSPPEFCTALAKGAQGKFGAAVTGLRQTAKGWEVLGGGGVIVSADIVVIAQGFGSRDFAQTGWLPLQSLRGQVTYLRPTAESKKLDNIICHDGYITPVTGGLHYIGATFQKENPGSGETRAEDDAENLEKLNRRLPQLKLSAAQIAGSRAGYRATTPDKLPMIGPAPDYEAFRENFAPMRTGKKTITDDPAYIDGLYISTGFGAHGLSGAPLAGEIIAAMISGEPLPVPQNLMEHLLPERFIFRGLKRKKI
ncbi:MAG: bifunctional tRNA (5-methylaminomethyl-2-thiouridine)(34)-methyltransferase MnmD/FAD-dependent 5-carboxymethylaminomethyl-2-thiouridine(34) oxidoreductase MnmC [Alphaproteobacteria bacterium]